jgi:hypothetical protein
MPEPAGLARWVGRPVRLRGEAHQEGIVKNYRADPPGLLVVLDYSEDLVIRSGSPRMSWSRSAENR